MNKEQILTYIKDCMDDCQKAKNQSNSISEEYHYAKGGYENLQVVYNYIDKLKEQS